MPTIPGQEGKTNRQISDKVPSQYFPKILEKVGQGAFDVQCIPTDVYSMGVDSYIQFLAERRCLISRRLNEFLGLG